MAIDSASWIVSLSVAILLTVTGCSKTQPTPEKRYPMQGEALAVMPQNKDAVIKAGAIGDSMQPMTMQYPVQPASDFAKLKAGEHITATVVVQGYNFYVTGIQVVPTPTPQ